MIGRYIRSNLKTAVVILLFTSVFFAVSLLYDIPLEPALYSTLLAYCITLVLFAFGCVSYNRRCGDIERLASSKAQNDIVLPEPKDCLEEDYQCLVKRIVADRNSLSSSLEKRSEDMMNYYTLWLHQIKTPISAMHLLIENGQGKNSEALGAELLKTEQYAQMALSYLRLDENAADFVFKKHSLDDIVRASVRKFSRLFVLKNINLEFEKTEKTVLTDEKWLCFLVEQILSNSLKYTPSGGKIKICFTNNSLVISDTGIGIREEDIPRVFEKGFTGYNGREDKKATGLGLYLCSETAKKLGAELKIVSAVGKGTSVFVSFCDDSNKKYE